MFEFIFLIALFTIMTWSAWYDTVSIAAVGVVVFGAVTWLFGTPANFAWLADPVTLISLVVVFLGIGALWSLWKWRRHVRSASVQRDIKESVEAYIKSKADRKSRYGEDYVEPAFVDSMSCPTTINPAHNKNRIVTWIVLWPFSMLVYFFEDLLMDIARWVYERLGKVYWRITLAAMPDTTK